MPKCKFGIEKTVTEALTMARRSIEATVEATWVSLGGCTGHLTAIRVWLAYQGQGKR
jgi:hypothetical protein